MKFLEENHIQGDVNSKIKIGLYYCNELVSLMTFNRQSVSVRGVSKEKVYELSRFCNKLNYVVIGSASKLFNFFIKTYDFNKIFTFSDRTYSSGDLYNKIGFLYMNTIGSITDK